MNVSMFLSHLTIVNTLDFLLTVLTVKPFGTHILSGDMALVTVSASLSFLYEKVILASTALSSLST